MDESIVKKQLDALVRRLTEKGLVSGTDDSVSLRLPGQAEMLIRSPDSDARSRSLRERSSSAEEASFALHGLIYREREDVGAIVLSQPRFAGALRQIPCLMPAVFDEQVRHLGDRVPRLEVSAEHLSDVDRKKLQRGDNIFLTKAGVLCLGMTAERAAFNLELFEKCAKSFLLAYLSGLPVRTIPWFVRFIARGRLRKDERRSAEAYRRGEVPVGIGGY